MASRPDRSRALSDRRVLKDLIRRIEALERRIAPRRASVAPPAASDHLLRWNIIEEDRLRREIAEEQALRRERPDIWREHQAARRAREGESVALASRLRAAGLPPPFMPPTLAQKMKNLRQLEARNRAELAKRQGGR